MKKIKIDLGNQNTILNVLCNSRYSMDMHQYVFMMDVRLFKQFLYIRDINQGFLSSEIHFS